VGKQAYTIGELLGSYPPPIRELAYRLRKVVLEVAAGVNEKANKGWRSISYRDPDVGYFCGIFPFEDHVDLIFEFGALLPDHGEILEGDAQQVRYLRFRDAKDLHAQPLRRLLGAALALPTSHSVRRGLAQSRHYSNQVGQKRELNQPRSE